MIQEPLDLRRALLLVRRRKILVCLGAVLGIVAGVSYAVLRPPTLTAESSVVLASTPQGVIIGTQVLVAGSDPVLSNALKSVRPAMSLHELRDRVTIVDETPTVLRISADGRTASEAESIANAVAKSYVDYVKQPGNLPDRPVQARVFEPATTATEGNSSSRVVEFGVLGALFGALAFAMMVVAVAQRDRRLRERDEIADSIGLPVLASMAVEHPSTPADWTNLLENYLPGTVDAWRLRKALQYLGFADLSLRDQKREGTFSLSVVSFSMDRRALALGPQLAIFAASRGIPTALVVGPQQDVNATATLRAACAASPTTPASLTVMISDDEAAPVPQDTALVVVVSVVDAENPLLRGPAARVAGTVPRVFVRRPSAATVLGVSAGVATAEQLARVAASAAVAGHDIIGILVADPDPADPTTGRLPMVSRPTRVRRPSRMTGSTLEIRHERG
jgi:capsular polysaccharide biosynthesis protein